MNTVLQDSSSLLDFDIDEEVIFDQNSKLKVQDANDDDNLKKKTSTEDDISKSLEFLSTENESISLNKKNFVEETSDAIKKVTFEDKKNNHKNIFRQVYDIILILFSLLYKVPNMIETQFNLFIDILFGFLSLSQRAVFKKLLKNVLLIAALIFTLVQSRNDGLKQNFETHKFFSRHSLVTDFCYGELSLLKEDLRLSELTLVMYYAPWDRQSQNLRPHFLKAAAFYHEQVSFAAINCWLPDSECRSHYRLHHYPIVVLHIKVPTSEETLAVPFNGPLTSQHIIKFISKSLRPFTHISSHADLLEAQLESQTIVLGYYDAGNFNPEFLSFYYSSMSKLQFEYMRDVRYGIITNPALAKLLSFDHKPSLHLVTWNATQMFPLNVEMNMKNITDFVHRHLSEVTHWLYIDGKKSLSLNKVLQEGPFVVIFSPDNPYHLSNDPYNLLRSVSLEYFNCDGSPLQHWVSNHLTLKTRSQLRDSDRICRKYLKNHLYYGSSLLNSLYQTEPRIEEPKACHQENSANICALKEQNSISHISWNSLWSIIDSQPLPPTDSCQRGDNAYYSCQNGFCKSKNESSDSNPSSDDDKHRKKTSHLNFSNGPVEDEKIPLLTDWVSEEHCKRLVLGSVLAPPPIFKEEKRIESKVIGLSCKTNKTLKFLTVDSLLHHDFAYRLGLNLSMSEPINTGAVIVDHKMEERYVLHLPLSRNSLSSFIFNYTYNLLDRSKVSSKYSRIIKDCGLDEVCVMELNADNYIDLTHTPGQVYVVLHYTHHCGACSAIGNIFLSCLHLTSSLPNINFGRIDISKNTLPWHLNFDTVPTIILYPSKRKSESRVFDSTLPISVQSLMTFVLTALSPSERLSLAFKVCDSECKRSILNQRSLLKIKIHHAISSTLSRLNRFNSDLVLLKTNLNENPKNTLIKQKYELLLEIKSLLNTKLLIKRRKLSHLHSLHTLYTDVPSDYPSLLSYETNLVRENSKIS